MIQEERYRLLLTQLKKNGRVSLEEMSESLHVSQDTIRRDIDLLAKRGLLMKVRGGALAPEANPLSFQDRVGLLDNEKKVIGLKSLPFLQQARTIFMDGGTTQLAVAAAIPPETRLRVITNNLSLGAAFAKHRFIEIVFLGGKYDRSNETTYGTSTCREVAGYQADLYLMGACAMDPLGGVTVNQQEEGEVKRVFLQNAFKTLLLGTSDKLGQINHYRVCRPESIEALITELPATDKQLDPYRQFDWSIL